ncbi:MAG: cell wall-binding repeat-containing protein [Chloroflexi bacterium]|nr:cell wall-binding repeat-containing protein [Chloroflexota bacterium]
MRKADLYVERRRDGSRRGARGHAILLTGLVVGGSLAMPATSWAADPPGVEGQRHLAETVGGFPNDFELLYERTAAVEHTDATLWAAKFVDHRTGEIHTVYHEPQTGAVAGTELQVQRTADAEARLSSLEIKADDELQRAVATKATDATVAIGVWLEVDVDAAERAVIDSHSELSWDGGRPLVDDLETARSIRAELALARAGARASALAQLRADAEALGGSIGYASTNAPLAYVDLPADRVEELAAMPAVSSLGLERTWTTAMSAAGPAVQANWTGGSEDRGTGVRVAVVEYHNVRNVGDLAGRVVASYSASGSLAYTSAGTFDHPTWVAGAIASQNDSYPGVAPGAFIVSASTGGGGASLTRDRQIIAAADWAASSSGGDADVVNASIGQDTATGSEEARRYFDALVNEDGRLAVAAAGNYATFGHWDILSPGTAYNVLTVGGIDDRGSAGRTDDRIWYYPGSNGSNYRDPTGTAWNLRGDYNKPNVSAPAPLVRTANGLTASGTSIASPIVAGIAAQVISRLPSVALRPEATRAIIMAGAINRSPMPDGSKNADHEGTGTASALWANRLLTAGDAGYGGHRMGSMTEGQLVTQEIAVVAGQKVKVVLSWNSRTSGSTIATRTDRLTADLDLRVVQPDGSIVGSYTFDNNYEWVEFTASRSGTARIELRQARFDATSERYGLAWSKWSVGTPIRLSGTDRYATAAAVSRSYFGANAPVAYVATGLNFPDALAAGAAAGVQGGPILLTATSSLPQATRDELTRLRPQRIVVLGGTSVVTSTVSGTLEAYTDGPVTRLAGVDRYATAAAVSRAVFASGVAAAFVATGESFPDALSAGPAAVKVRGPVLLTARGSTPQALRDELARLKPQRIYLLGGTSAVTDAVKQTIQGYTAAPVVRLSGADRFATAVAVSKTFFSRPPAVHLATGMNFPDALSAVPAAGRAGAPLLLVGQSSLPNPVRTELTRLFPPRCYVIGGTAVIGNTVVSQLNALLGKP